MLTTPPEDLFERSFRFACDVYDYCEDLVHLRGLPCRLAYQLFDAAGSVGANRAESRFAYSDKEFAVKNATALNECSEALFWLRVADKKSLGQAHKRKYLLKESNELTSIYASTVKKLKAKLRAEKARRNRSTNPPPLRA